MAFTGENVPSEQNRVDSTNSSNFELNFVQNKMMQEEVETDTNVFSFAPKVFRYIRAIDNISEYDIMMSVKPQLNKHQIFKSNSKMQNDDSGGNSSSFFFFTEDKKFIIKTITVNEKNVLLRMLPETV